MRLNALAEDSAQTLVDYVNVRFRVDLFEDPAAAVELHQRLGLLVVDLQPVPDGILFVVLTLKELAAVDITATRYARRV